jgi:two-component system phosphate regulon response regulator PhoB
MITLLVVDDDQLMRDFLTALFGDEGYRASAAADGREALTLVQRETPNLILSDIAMPELGGIELCQRLKRQDETRQIPFILMSARAYQTSDSLVADAFIEKPFSIAAIEELVQRFVGD